ncbi:MAG: hypothetical protein V3T70_09395 [Phycisphaerae bacterium]
MDSTFGLLIQCSTAAAIGAVHTLLGPDHYLPFAAMARAGRWSLRRTLGITALCGGGHVLASIAVGMIAVAVGAAVTELDWIQATRGRLVGWLLLAFGLAYTVWGVRQAIRNRPHAHWHAHADGTVHEHRHVHHGSHVHVHTGDEPMATAQSAARMTPWILFTIFIFGPCEPLIPLLMYAAATNGASAVLIIALVYACATIGTMTALVAVCCLGWRRLPTAGPARYGHAAAGLVILACGAAVQLGL